MSEQLTEAIRREHPLVDQLLQLDEDDQSLIELAKTTYLADQRIASEMDGNSLWSFFAVPPIIRSGYRLGVFNPKASKDELFLIVNSLVCVGYDIGEKASLFRMDFLISLLRRGLVENAIVASSVENRYTGVIDQMLGFIEDITAHGSWLRRAREVELSKHFKDFLDKLDLSGI